MIAHEHPNLLPDFSLERSMTPPSTISPPKGTPECSGTYSEMHFLVKHGTVGVGRVPYS